MLRGRHFVGAHYRLVEGLSVEVGGQGVVAHVGTALLRLLADRSGLSQALSAALTRCGFSPGRDGGRVLVDLAVMIADGGEAIADVDVLRHQDEVFGRVASPATCWRALDEVNDVQLRRISRARARVRAGVWSLIGAVPAARAGGRELGDGVVVLDVDSTIVLAHSEKDGAAGARPARRRRSGTRRARWYCPVWTRCGRPPGSGCSTTRGTGMSRPA